MLLGMLVALSANAQTLTKIEVSPFAGYLFGGTILSFNFSTPLPNIHVADHLTYGLRLGFNVTPNIEPGIHWSHTHTSVSPPIDNPQSPLTIDFLLAGVAYNFSSGQTRPYLSAGLGAGFFSGHRINFSNHTLLTGSLALGVKHFFTRNIGLQLETRGYASKPDRIIKQTCNPSCAPTAILNGDVTGGLTVAF